MNINWRTFVNTLRGLGLTPVRLVLVGGALALLSLPFVFVAQAAESPLQTIPAVAFASAASSGAESTTPANLEVTLSAASELTVTVAYAVTGGTATGGVDYTLLGTGTLTFVPGDTSETVAITIVDDALDEADEIIEVTLSNPSNATLGGAVHTYTILDNDGLIVSGQGVSIVIGDGNTIGVIIIGHGNTIGNVIIGDSTNEGDNAGRGKTAICHKGKKTLSIGYSAVPAHQAHGDTLGLCP